MHNAQIEREEVQAKGGFLFVFLTVIQDRGDCYLRIPKLIDLSRSNTGAQTVTSDLMGGSREATIFRLAKGMYGRSKNCYKLALRRVEKGLQHAYRGRKLKKREARSEWIQQVGAGSREHGITYARLMQGMQQATTSGQTAFQRGDFKVPNTYVLHS